MKRIDVLEGLRGLGWAHEDRLTNDVTPWERAFVLLAGQGPDEVQREGCGQKVGDDLRLTVVKDEDRRATLLVAWSEVQRCLHHPGLHLTRDQLHSSEPVKDRKCNTKQRKQHACEHQPSPCWNFHGNSVFAKKNMVTTTDRQNWKAHACIVTNTIQSKQHVSEYHTKSGLRASCGSIWMEPHFFDSNVCNEHMFQRLPALQHRRICVVVPLAPKSFPHTCTP